MGGGGAKTHQPVKTRKTIIIQLYVTINKDLFKIDLTYFHKWIKILQRRKHKQQLDRQKTFCPQSVWLPWTQWFTDSLWVFVYEGWRNGRWFDAPTSDKFNSAAKDRNYEHKKRRLTGIMFSKFHHLTGWILRRWWCHNVMMPSRGSDGECCCFLLPLANSCVSLLLCHLEAWNAHYIIAFCGCFPLWAYLVANKSWCEQQEVTISLSELTFKADFCLLVFLVWLWCWISFPQIVNVEFSFWQRRSTLPSVPLFLSVRWSIGGFMVTFYFYFRF